MRCVTICKVGGRGEKVREGREREIGWVRARDTQSNFILHSRYSL
nr:MAG TPA: hypothetical protein [Caudoviricetes sp.]